MDRKGNKIAKNRVNDLMRENSLLSSTVSISTIDQEQSRVVTVEGFVYPPGIDKRPLVRNQEAIAYSLQLNNKK